MEQKNARTERSQAVGAGVGELVRRSLDRVAGKGPMSVVKA
jgi:hypothetical protein